jgi:DNA-binding helix-hairpin-helix protein with protein kinase domain
LIIAEILFLYPGKELREMNRRKNLLKNARYGWHVWKTKWESEAGDDTFRTQLDRLYVLKHRYETLETEYKTALASLQKTTRDRHQKKFLENYNLDASRFRDIGADKKAWLWSHGIRTAADITRSNLAGSCPLDRIQREELISWRKSIEKLFLFDPTKGTDTSDSLALIHTFQPRLKPVERELQSGIERIIRVQQEIMHKRATLKPIVEKSAQELAQAETNVKAMKILGIF